jgi:hypothetical protein
VDAVQDNAETFELSKDAHCLLCSVGSPQHPAHAAFGDADVILSEEGDAVVLMARNRGHVQVVPAAHVAQLSALPNDEMAHVLAALRRVAVTQRPLGGTFRLSPVDLRGSQGHVCIRVGPASGRGTPVPDRESTVMHDPAGRRPS